MNLTPHHARYFTHDLTRRDTSGMDRLSMALFDAAVDRNPHQIDAALFALQSPLSTGVILAGDVGLHANSFRSQYAGAGSNLEDLKTPDDLWKVRLIEEDSHRLMFEMEGA